MPEQLVRCFIAVDIDDPEVVSKVVEMQKILDSTGADIKLVEPYNLHLTLWFLGEIPEKKVMLAMEALKKLRFRKFSIALRGLGYFPGGGRINVIWIGVEDRDGNLRKIHEDLLRILAPLNFSPDEKGFSPHLTLCRVRSAREKSKLIDVINSNKNLYFGVQNVDKICLKKSTLTSKGPIYENLLIISGE